CQQGYTPPLTF
nr:immunoglobulin light chain junction region [Macaca mulatta]MOV80568.1 immunoglobulin light chain junction region [Macaca mulatta]MOV84095.1 immunoglobulin light chain junction region [Macaca mulatta]